jgi:hypothetical protein
MPHASPAVNPCRPRSCEALEMCDLSADATPTRVAAGTCLPSYDAAAGEATGRTAYLLLRGDNVPWASGELLAGGPAGAPAAAPSPVLSPDLSPEPSSPSPSPDASPEPSSPSPSPDASPEPSSPTPTPDGQCPEGTKNCGGSNGLLCILTNQDRMVRGQPPCALQACLLVQQPRFRATAAAGPAYHPRPCLNPRPACSCLPAELRHLRLHVRP